MLEGPMVEHVRQLTARASAAIRPYLPRRLRSDLPVVPVVRLGGVIGLSTPLRPGLSVAGIARMLDRAFGFRHAKAVALSINSPGGSAVQSHLIYRRIRTLADEKKLPVIAFVEDVAASGGYMLACAADEIVCDPASIVGSIGVIGASFGFPEAMRKLDAGSVPSGERARRSAPQGAPAGHPPHIHCACAGAPRRAAQRSR
jgi:serine protease SohB